MEFFAGYHEGRQIGSVNGKEHHSKHGPNVGHESKNVRKKKLQNMDSYHQAISQGVIIIISNTNTTNNTNNNTNQQGVS
jgi:hypothetical protein